MSDIREFKCTYSNSVGISAETTAGLGLEFPDAYMHSETMQILAKAIKTHDDSDFVLLPFCRTITARMICGPFSGTCPRQSSSMRQTGILPGTSCHRKTAHA